jgi:hypothetical protein
LITFVLFPGEVTKFQQSTDCDYRRTDGKLGTGGAKHPAWQRASGLIWQANKEALAISVVLPPLHNQIFSE